MGVESYDGNSIFGLAVRMTTEINPSGDQINAFFGVSGMESLFGGQRGRVTLVTGLLYANSSGNLQAAEDLFTSYNDGIARVLVNTRGKAYGQVKFGVFAESGDKDLQGSDGTWYRPYRASFNHLVQG